MKPYPSFSVFTFQIPSIFSIFEYYKQQRKTLKMSEVISKNEEQVKSKKRVTDHGEVFTSEREVNAMLDLVKQETERIESRFERLL